MAKAKLTSEKLNKCCWKKKKKILIFFLVSAIKCEACRHCRPPLRTDGRTEPIRSPITTDPWLPCAAIHCDAAPAAALDSHPDAQWTENSGKTRDSIREFSPTLQIEMINTFE